MSGMNNAASSSATADDTKSSFIAFTIASYFVAIQVVLGIYFPETFPLGPETILLGSNASILINPNRLFVKFVEVKEVGGAKGSMLYGFYKNPPLVEMKTWQETHKIPLPSSTRKEWAYHLNEGSQINISYSVASWGSSSIFLVIAKGNTELAEWLKDPSYLDRTFSWNIIHGNGSLQKNILKSSAYYIGVSNLNPEIVTVNLNMTIKASLYETTEPYYKCAPADRKCTFQLFYVGENAAVLTCPGLLPGMVSGKCKVKLSYGPQWNTYFFGAGGMFLLRVLIAYFHKHFRRTKRDIPRDQLLFCAICCEAPKDSFFSPCRHCLACFGCATRILETSADCPVCRRKTEKVKKIYIV